MRHGRSKEEARSWHERRSLDLDVIKGVATDIPSRFSSGSFQWSVPCPMPTRALPPGISREHT